MMKQETIQQPALRDAVTTSRPEESMKRCNHCGNTLPASAFYRVASGRYLDSYCKACRWFVNETKRNQKLLAGETARRTPQRLITAAADKAERIRLILEAKQEIMHRRREARARRDREEELLDAACTTEQGT